jgi:hypothetical protein
VRAARYLAVSAALVGGFAWTGTASALIVPQHSIARVELQMTRPEVRATKGEPDRIRHGMNDFGAFTEFTYRNGYGKLRVTFQGNAGATAVFTNRPSQHTAERIHVGSTETKLHEAYQGLHCRTELSSFRHCWTGRFKPGRRVTDYRIDLATMRVKTVLVGFVID